MPTFAGLSGPRTGLTSAEARETLARVGPNRPPRPPRRSLLSRIWGQLSDPMIALLMAAFVVVVALGDVPDAIIIAAVVVVNSAIGVTQEVRAETAVAALDRMAAPHATVVRDGRFQHVDAAEVVPGDLVRLEAGDVVPADGTLLDSAALQVDESALTGESVPVAHGDQADLQSGTVVTRGRGLLAVTATGADSGLGRIAALISSQAPRPTPLQQRLAGLSRLLVVVTLGVAAVVSVLGVLRGEGVADMLVLGVSLAVAAIPESLPAVVSVALALGAHRMARRSAIVRWLPAVETLGSVSVLASDKTGTLTENRMVVQRLWTPGGELEVTGHGYEVAGGVGGAPHGSVDREDAVRLLRDVTLCNDAHLGGPEGGAWRVVGDPMEAALLVAAAKAGVTGPGLRRTWRRRAELPFDSERQRMTTFEWADPGAGSPGEGLVVCKGAPERVLALLPVDDPVEEARAVARRLAHEGFRVLAVADRTVTARPEEGTLEEGLRLVGLAAISDPPRANAHQVVADCRRAGIRTVLITGDHPETATAVADEIGVRREEGEVAQGTEVASGSHRARVDRIDVYARTKPEQKVDVLAALQAAGHVVAMTGDGVNDAPALRRADIGVAMGGRGTEVARQAADLVLADDDLATVVVAVAEGRRIFSNIRTFLRFGLSGGLAEVLVLLVGPFVGLAAPLTAAQILWINMLTHGVPGVAFSGEPLDDQVMGRPSPSPERSVLGDGLWRQILAGGALIFAMALAAGLWARHDGQHVQTAVFLTLGLAQLGVALALRSPRRGVPLRGRGLEAAVALATVLQLLPLVFAPLGDLLGTEMPDLTGFLLVVGLATVPGLAIAVTRRVAGRRGGGRARNAPSE